MFTDYLPEFLCFFLFQSALITEKTLSSFDLDVRTEAFGPTTYAIISLLPGLTVNILERPDTISARVAKLNYFPVKVASYIDSEPVPPLSSRI